jgi:hypothetical protein
MGLVMNRFLSKPDLKMEFKMVQRLPAFSGVTMGRCGSSGTPEAVVPDLKQEALPELLAAMNGKPFTATRRNAPS